MLGEGLAANILIGHCARELTAAQFLPRLSRFSETPAKAAFGDGDLALTGVELFANECSNLRCLAR